MERKKQFWGEACLGLGEIIVKKGFRAEGLLGEQFRSETRARVPWLGGSVPATPLRIAPPPGGLPGGGDRLSDETHYALNPPD